MAGFPLIQTKSTYTHLLQLYISLSFYAYTHTQELGEERGDDVVFSVCLKRVRYCCQATDSHLQWNAHKVKTLRAGSIAKLVEHLAPYMEHVDVSYRTCFLCTYRTFSTAGEVLQLLKERLVVVFAYKRGSPSEFGQHVYKKFTARKLLLVISLVYYHCWFTTCSENLRKRKGNWRVHKMVQWFRHDNHGYIRSLADSVYV